MAMDNKTVRDAIQVHGTNPQFLIEKILRTRIYESTYWKESCFGLTESSIIEKAYELNSIGGQYGIQKPTEFICLVLKLLQLQPREEIVIKYITGLTENDSNKYLRALGAFYLRLVGKPVDIYKNLEPLLVDGRKLRKRGNSGYSIIHMDEFIDELLREERVCDVVLPRLTKRYVFEDTGELNPRISALEAVEMELEQEREAEEAAARDERVAFTITVPLPFALSLSVKIKIEIQVSLELAVRITIKISQSFARTAQTTGSQTFEIIVKKSKPEQKRKSEQKSKQEQEQEPKQEPKQITRSS
ncbi:hypothetical protein KI688_012685 [Linnemannia hyalina]|uniref:Pre-mRNA-splicing factor 38 n=1 Tax=Linnemannia hyalina TaxID=64524 RepID=A0A9P8BS64_9FUNG|nr:hypothetical protein KI688_012685 [Linnemannia hyalina]